MNTLLDYKQTAGDDWSVHYAGMLFNGFQETLELPKPRKQLAKLIDLEEQMARYQAEHEALITEVRKQYVLPADSSVVDFLHDRRTLPQLLLEAKPHLEEYFGGDAVFRLRCPIDESGSQTLYAVAMWPGRAMDVRTALDSFDDAWWISNSRQASGHLIFTYELV
jgi:hypothetical protein